MLGMANPVRFLVAQVLPLGLLVAVALLASTVPTGAQSPTAESTFRLADGTAFTARVVRVDEEWVEVDRDGWRLQLPWWAVDGAPITDERRKSLDTDIGSSVAEYARWAHWQGLTAERDRHTAIASAAGAAANLERRLPDWYIQRLPAAQRPVVAEPEPEVGPERPPTRAPDRPTATKRPKPESVTVTPAKASGETKSLAEAVTKKVKERGMAVKDKGGAATITIGEVTLTTVRRVTWFGNIHELVKNGSFELKVKWPDGHEQTETLTSSNHLTRRSDAEVDEKVRNDLASLADSWLRREVLRD